MREACRPFNTVVPGVVHEAEANDQSAPLTIEAIWDQSVEQAEDQIWVHGVVIGSKANAPKILQRGLVPVGAEVCEGKRCLNEEPTRASCRVALLPRLQRKACSRTVLP